MRYSISKTTKDSLLLSHPDKSAKIIIKRKDIKEDIPHVSEKTCEDIESKSLEVSKSKSEKSSDSIKENTINQS